MVLSKCREKTRDAGICVCFVDWRNLPALTDALQAAGWVWRGVVVWDKLNSRPQKGRFKNQCEFAVWGSNGPLPVDRPVGCLPGVYQCLNVAPDERHHQVEKPVRLIEQILEIVPRGTTVFDPFMGSGTTGVACANTGRDFIGIELDPGYFATAQKRIREVQAQTRFEGM